MLKVFKTFVATVALSQKIILLLDEVPSLQLSPSLSHWNIGKLGEEESCSGLRVVGGITNRFFPSFFLFFSSFKVGMYSKSKRAMWGKSKCIYRGQHHEQKMRERFLFCPAATNQPSFHPPLPPIPHIPWKPSRIENSRKASLELWVFDGWYRKQFSLSVWAESAGPPPFTIHPNCPLVPAKGEDMIEGVGVEGRRE